MAVTRNDVARRAGVSPAVVSYVLNEGSRPVAPATRERVLRAILELGYRPDGLARSLRNGRTDTIGLLVPDATNPFFASLARAVEDAANERGCGVIMCNSADDPRRERVYIERLAERRIDGLVLASTNGSDDLRELTDLSIPVIALDRSPDAVPVSTIRTDNEASARIATVHLIEHGHEIIAFVGGIDGDVSEARQLGWRTALHEAGRRLGPSLRASFSYEGGYDAAQDLFGPAASDCATPTAVFVSSDVQAIGFLSAVHALGLRVPQDIAIVSMDGTTAARYCVPALTTFAQPILQMGTRAVNHLIDELSQIVHETLNGELVIAASCGCLPARE